MLRIVPDEIVMPADVPNPTPVWPIVGIVAAVVAISVVICVVLVKHKKKGKE